ENVDVPACRERGIRVVHTPGANTRAVVEYVAALLADALRPRVYLTEATPAARWHDLRRVYVARRQVDELTLGVYGLGRIGSAVARLGAALNMTVLYNDLLEIPESRRSGAAPVPAEELLRRSDVVSVHVDYRPENKHLLNERTLGLMKKD